MTFTENLTLALVSGLLAGIVTAAVSYFGFWRQAKAEIQKEYETKYTERKWEVYLKVVNLVPMLEEYEFIGNEFDYLRQVELGLVESQDDGSLDEEERNAHIKKRVMELYWGIEKTWRELENEILLIGSLDVVDAFFKWKNKAHYSATSKDEITVNLFVSLINKMREDLGKTEPSIDSHLIDGAYYLSSEYSRKYPI